EITTTATPINRRWGGWYVTGTHGEQSHLGNFIISDTSVLRQPGFHGINNLSSLDTLVELDKYPRQSSDIVALLVLEHQVEVQNRITRVNYDGRMLLEQSSQLDEAALQTLVRPLLDTLFMAEEAPLQGPVEGTSDYAANF